MTTRLGRRHRFRLLSKGLRKDAILVVDDMDCGVRGKLEEKEASQRAIHIHSHCFFDPLTRDSCRFLYICDFKPLKGRLGSEVLLISTITLILQVFNENGFTVVPLLMVINVYGYYPLNGYQWMQTQNPLDVLKTLPSASVKDSVCRLDFPSDFQSLLSSEYSTLESVTKGFSDRRKVNKFVILKFLTALRENVMIP